MSLPTPVSLPTPEQSQSIIQAMVDSLLDIAFVKDLDGRYLMANQAAADWLGIPLEAMLGKRDDELFPPEVAAFISESDRSIVEANCSKTYEEDIDQGGRVRSLLTQKFPWRDENGQPMGVVGICRDITERKQTQQSLHRSEQLNKAILSALPDLITRMDVDGTLLDVNSGNFSVGCLSSADVGKNVRELLPPALAEKTFKLAAQALKTGKIQRHEFSTQGKSQHHRREARIVPLSDHEVLVSTRDFTKLHQTKVALERSLHEEKAAREEAERANRIKDEFLTVLSHELRSPLNPISGWASLLLRGDLDEARIAQAAETIQRNAKLLTQLIDDLLDVARMLRGKIKLEKRTVLLKRVILQALETVELAAQSKALTVDTQLDETIYVKGDETRLQQAVWNLLSNAVKFTPENGKITVRLKAIGQTTQIEVGDTGVGISSGFLPYVFERFRQEDGTITRQFGGLGLGLAIVRQISELHGGSVSVESEGENKGATFMVQLPMLLEQTTQAHNTQNPQGAESTLENCKILIVDDDIDSLEILSVVLEAQGADVTQVVSGEACLAQLDQWVPDILICDIGMPELDGYELLRTIRNRPTQKGGDIKALALTAYAGEQYKTQALNAGFHAYLAKPIDINAVVDTLQSVICNT